MEMEQGNESHVLLLLDDVKPRHNFSVERMIDAMRTFNLDMVSAAIQKFSSFVSPTLQPSLHCVARKVSFVDPLLLLFKRKAWKCWLKEINTTINRMGWGYSITFGSRRNASVGVIDTEVAVHEPSAPVQHNCVYGADANGLLTLVNLCYLAHADSLNAS